MNFFKRRFNLKEDGKEKTTSKTVSLINGINNCAKCKLIKQAIVELSN